MTTGTGLTTTVRAIDDTIDHLINQQSFTFSLFGTPQSPGIAFSGTVSWSLDATGSSATFTGQAQLGAPFNATVPIIIRADTSRNWLVKFQLPGVAAMIGGLVPSSLAHAYETVLQPYLAMFDHAWVAVASGDMPDPDLHATIHRGLNLLATVRPFTVLPLSYLTQVSPQADLAGIRGGVQIAFGGSSFRVLADFSANAELISGVTLSHVALEFEADRAVTAGATLTFDVRAGTQKLRVIGNMTAASDDGVAVWARLDTVDHAWPNPFGVPGLTLNDVGFGIGLGPQAPYASLSSSGDAAIGGVDLQYAMAFDSQQPSHSMLSISSARGVDLRLVAAAMGAPLSPLLHVSVSDFVLRIVPEDTTVNGQSYSRGVTLAGDLDLWGFDARLSGSFDTDNGFSLQLATDPVNLAVAGRPVLMLSSVNPATGPSVAIAVGPHAQSGHVDLRIGIPPLPPLPINVAFTSSSLLGFAAPWLSDVFAGSGVAIAGSVVRMVGSVHFDYTIDASSIPLIGSSLSTTVRIDAQETIEIDVARRSCSFTLAFTAGPLGVTVPLTTSLSAPLPSLSQVKGCFSQLMTSGADGASAFWNALVAAAA